MCEKQQDPDWPEVDDFVASHLPEGADDPYVPDDEAPAEWWTEPNPKRPRRA